MSNDIDFDREHVWHPYTSMIDPLPVFSVRHASGVYIELESGERLIDGMSSWWSAVHGYNNPLLNQAAHTQIDNFSHVMFGGLTHSPAIELARRLIDITPAALERIFYCDSGSVAVEVALKMALQYQRARGEAGRNKNRVATIRGGYHGDTWHAMSLCDPEVGMHSLYSGSLPDYLFVPRPKTPLFAEWDDADLAPLERLFEEHHGRLAAFIIEPIVQGAGGMWFYHPNYLSRLRTLCDHYDVLLIADEIATGFGRTGRMFACEWAEVTPDILCLGKAITGGYMSFAATMTTSAVALAISQSPPYALMHGPTFMANPLACAVANASLELLSSPSLLPRIAAIERALWLHLEPARSMAGVVDLRIVGAIGVVELDGAVDMAQFQRQSVDLGVWIRPFGRLVYIMPPYIITDSQLETLCLAMLRLVEQR